MKKALLIVAGVLSAAIITASAKADDLILGTGAGLPPISGPALKLEFGAG